MTEENEIKGELVIYQSADGLVKIQPRFENETIWMSQAEIAELFQTTQQNVSQHIANIIEESELDPVSTHKKFLLVRQEGTRMVEREIDHFNLDMIISVGYRVKSVIATRFRIWATERLREYLIKGFTMDDERLKNPPVAGNRVPDYFDEMLARIRDIRASERRVYLRVKEIFAMAADYQPTDTATSKFFSVIQNKLHFAATGKTAAEIIRSRADVSKPNMGLTNWKADEIRKTDVTIAKNYLAEKEIDELNRIVTMWLDFAEDQAKRRKQVFMNDWELKLDEFLRFNDREVLPNAGTISRDNAEKFAHEQFSAFAEKRRIEKESRAEKDFLDELSDMAMKSRRKKK